MDDELTSDYRDPCGQCSAVDWGITEEGRFYCRSCHNVIERTHDVTDTSFVSNSRASSISKATRKKSKLEKGQEWMVCEGFQFILKHQAEALLAIGVCPRFKDDVLCNFWRRYLQKTRQAYTKNPVHAGKFSMGLDFDSAPESLGLSEDSWASMSETEGEQPSAANSASGWSSDGMSSVCSGSLDGCSYWPPQRGKGRKCVTMTMTMPMTLAFCHLGLLWLREALTLGDLLRFAAEGHVPYINAYKDFPEEMKLYGRDVRIFRVESIPSHRRVQQEAHSLAVFLDLPRFSPITRDCMLHPYLLSLRYLTEANLPDELHSWVCRVLEQAGIGEETYLTFDPMERKSRLPSLDLLAAALIIVTMKLLFKLDDVMEWTLSNKADDENKKNEDASTFSVRKWFKVVQRALSVAMEKEKRDKARQPWKTPKPLYTSGKKKPVVLKRRRMVEQLQVQFRKLAGPPPEPSAGTPSSFRFCWGEGGGDGPSFHHQHLGCAVTDGLLSNPEYWHTALRPCNPRHCSDHFRELEPSLSRSFVAILGLFSFLLGVRASQVHVAVCQVERHLLRGVSRIPAQSTAKPTQHGAL